MAEISGHSIYRLGRTSGAHNSWNIGRLASYLDGSIITSSGKIRRLIPRRTKSISTGGNVPKIANIFRGSGNTYHRESGAGYINAHFLSHNRNIPIRHYVPRNGNILINVSSKIEYLIPLHRIKCEAVFFCRLS